MGGFGSGRSAQHATCEDSLKLDLAEPAIRAALHPSRNTNGVWTWSSQGRSIASISYVWNAREHQLTLSYTCSGKPVVQRIALTSSTPNYGGKRWWFYCRFSRRRVRVLYLPSGAREWAGRHAYDLRYRSQREVDVGRSMLGLLSRCKSWPGDTAMAAALAKRSDPLGFKEEARWERREQAQERRNAIRRLARRQAKEGEAGRR